MQISRLHSGASDFGAQLQQLLACAPDDNAAVEEAVRDIIATVKAEGDAALLELTARFDHWAPETITDLALSADTLEEHWRSLAATDADALQQAADRVRDYHQRQLQQSWQYTEPDGTVLGQQITALQAVGIYVPGGKASYPSSVLMNALPAQVAGVDRICMMVPTPAGELSPMVLAAAHLAGVDEVWRVGGAQAVAALAYGTESVQKVDKITGPGNLYVATAKRQVFGQVGLDMIAGPSEILIIADGTADPEWLALDMFAQAEHDEMAQSILLCPDADYLQQVHDSMRAQLPRMPRKAIIAESLQNRGALVEVASLDDAVELANQIAPEHLQLAVSDAGRLLPAIRNAGAVFVGSHTPEAFGDYCAGPNHVLPTSGTARFASPLGVYDFQKRTSVINCSASAADRLGRIAGTLAYGEGLSAHALSALARTKQAD